MPEPLSLDEVRHVAKLARLRLEEEQLARYRSQLADVLDHIAKLNELDVEGVEPMAHPSDVTNRLAEDEVAPPMPVEALLANAPATEDHFLAVPKILGDGEEP
ncbi:MAG: Asp-tRNA(Asn)/Glu-tRNA(Gln) amidotransferase subunit GatC [Planctomycetota bacterium]